MMDDSNIKNTFSVRDFYRGKNIMVTGCTGFLGKVILEKLMRSCPEINRIYILVRPKRNKKPIDRVKEILESYCFSAVKKTTPNFQ